MSKSSFIMCSNASCSRAGWCKRFTYIQTSHGDLNPEDFNFEFFTPDLKYSCYVKNVTRRVYERENPDDTYDEFNREEYENNNRESRMRQDNPTYRNAQEALLRGLIAGQDRLLQLQRSGDRRSDNESDYSIRPAIERDFFQELADIAGTAIVLQDASQHGIPPIRIEPRRTDDGLPTEDIRTDDSATDIGSDEQEQQDTTER